MKAVFVKCALYGSMILAVSGLGASDKDKQPSAKMEPRVVDSGAFGIYVDGKRVGTETFRIEQKSDYSIATAQIKVDDGKTQAEQSAEMQISPNGDLRSYTWKSILPVHEEATVEPTNELLMEHIMPADQKKVDMPHILPLSTTILDDNFFSQREILMWRYLATACVRKNQQLSCGQGKYGILVPHQHAAFNATVELQGTDRVSVNGALRELNKVLLKTVEPQRLVVINSDKDADPDWVIWLDDQYKVIKISIPGARVEVTRD